MTYAIVGALCGVFLVAGLIAGYAFGFDDGKLNEETAAREEI